MPRGCCPWGLLCMGVGALCQGAAAPGVLLAAVSCVYVPEPPPKTAGWVFLKAFPSHIPRRGYQGTPPPGLALSFSPLQGLCRGTSPTHPLPKTSTPPKSGT